MHPFSLKEINNKIFISSTSSFRRHITQESWENFNAYSLEKLTEKNKIKLGVAMGKMIAKNLVICFENEETKKGI